MDEFEVSGQVVIVTGAGRGIGRATAVAFARHGSTVYVTDRDRDAASQVAADIREHGGHAMARELDVADEGQIRSAVEVVLAAHQRIDALIANAAVMPWGNILETSPEEWDRQMAVNLRGPYLCIRGVLPAMVAQRSGAIVVVSSDCAVRTCNDMAGYVTAKTGLLGLARSVAVDFGRFGIRSNVIVPGVTETPGFVVSNTGQGRTPAATAARAGEYSPLGRLGQPEDVATAALFLCSDAARFITGAVLPVDGGMTVTYRW